MEEDSRKIKKNFIKILCFVILFIYLLIGTTYILRADSDKKQRFAGFYAEPKNSIDVIFIGSSPVHPYWAAPLAWKNYGFTSYPLSTDVQQPNAAIYILKEALKTQAPKVVVFELRMFERTQEAFDIRENQEAFLRNVTDNMRYSVNRFQAINAIISDKFVKSTFYFDIMKYHGQWKSIKPSALSYWDLKKTNLVKGHFVMDKVIDLTDKGKDCVQTKEIAAMPLEQEIHLKEILEYCKMNQVEALFTINPYPVMNDESLKKFNYMQALVEEQGFHFVDLNSLYDEMKIDLSQDFYDGGHMNVLGAEKFTNYLGNYILQHYNLPNKHTTQEYESWNDVYEFWRKKADIASGTIHKKIQEGNYDE